MTEPISQFRVDEVKQIYESVEKCEQQMNKLMERLQWSRDKLPKPRNPTKNVPESYENESAETNQIDSTSKSSVSVALNDISSDFPEFGDRGKLRSTSYNDLNKLKRDMRRQRLKHRVTKTAPLTYTEEIRELIAIQMDIEKNRHKK